MTDNVSCHYLDIAHDNVFCDGQTFSRPDFIGPTQPWFWGFLSIYVALVLFAGECAAKNKITPTCAENGLTCNQTQAWCLASRWVYSRKTP